MKRVRIGLERLRDDYRKYLAGRRVGIVANHTSFTPDFVHAVDLIAAIDGARVQALFAPEHGLWGTHQDMVSVPDLQETRWDIAVHSLYGSTHESLTPDPSLLDEVDAVVFDIQDVGSRYYTYVYTLAHVMEICATTGRQIIVCDRPNPINGVSLEGNTIEADFFSFVGEYPLINRHGMTVGELGRFFATQIDPSPDLIVVPMEGWTRSLWFDETGLPWIMPSPNMPSLDTAIVYPGGCLIEGTLLSEGRGTTRPFELIGAPYVDPFILADRMQRIGLPGVSFRPTKFLPKFQKHAEALCGGVQVHVTNRAVFQPFRAYLSLIHQVKTLWPEAFQWRKDIYEFVQDKLAIDLLYGNSDLRVTMDSGKSPSVLFPRLIGMEERFAEWRKCYLLYCEQ